MPIIFYFIIFLFSAFPVTPEKNDASNVLKIDEIAFFLKDGSSKELAKYFENGIELNINGNQGAYSRIQAELVMRNFFKKYPPEDFEVIHQGGNFDQIMYFIGNYSTENLFFRVLIKSKSINEDLRIFSMDILRN